MYHIFNLQLDNIYYRDMTNYLFDDSIALWMWYEVPY